MLECRDVSFSYTSSQNTPESGSGALAHISCKIQPGSFVLLCGPSGCGKTTLTRLFNGLIPHYYEGALTGCVTLDGADIKDLSLFDISRRVGSVFQNPRAQFFNVDTTSELAFGPENHGLPEEEVRLRVKCAAEQLSLTPLLGRSIFSLSGGQKQLIACGSAAALEPDIYVLDEPSSNLDAYAIAGLRALLSVWKAQGKTVIISEHRLYYLNGLIDRALYLKGGQICGDYTAAELRQLSDTQREAMGLRPLTLHSLGAIPPAPVRGDNKVWALEQLRFAYPRQAEALCLSSASFPAGGVTAVIGRSGAGKTTLLRCICGLEKRCRGTVSCGSAIYTRRQRLKACYMVMQDVKHQLFTESVLDEVLLSMPCENVQAAKALLAEMDLSGYEGRHPISLSGGQKQRVAVASALSSGRPFILFDEPTSGLDLFHMRQVAACVNRVAAHGRTVLVVTHDPEFILRCCNFVLHLEDGRLVESYSIADSTGRQRILRFFLQDMEAEKDGASL